MNAVTPAETQANALQHGILGKLQIRKIFCLFFFPLRDDFFFSLLTSEFPPPTTYTVSFLYPTLSFHVSFFSPCT